MIRLAADTHGGFAELRGGSAGGLAKGTPGRDPRGFIFALRGFKSTGRDQLYRSREIGGLAPRVANGALVVAGGFLVPGERGDAGQQDQRNDHRRQAGAHPEGGAAFAVHDWRGYYFPRTEDGVSSTARCPSARGSRTPGTRAAATVRRTPPDPLGRSPLVAREPPRAGMALRDEDEGRDGGDPHHG